MPTVTRPMALLLCLLIASSASARGEDTTPYSGPACSRNRDAFFEREVWDNVGGVRCVPCHKEGSDAEESALLLQDPRKLQGDARDDAMRRNRDAFARLARVREGDQSRLLVKATGGLDHGGGDVLTPGSRGHSILVEFVRRVNAPSTTPAPAPTDVDDTDRPPFFEGVVMLDAGRLLRRATLALAGRLPTPSERDAVAEDGNGLDALPPVLDSLMREDAFYDRLREGFNDIFLTLGIDGNPEATVLSYEHFTRTRLWTQKHDLGHIPEKDRQKERYKLAADYRKALLGVVSQVS